MLFSVLILDDHWTSLNIIFCLFLLDFFCARWPRTKCFHQLPQLSPWKPFVASLYIGIELLDQGVKRCKNLHESPVTQVYNKMPVVWKSSCLAEVLTFLFPLLLTGSKFRAFSVELTTLQPLEGWHTMLAVRIRDVQHPSQAKRKCPLARSVNPQDERKSGGIWQHLTLLTCGSKVFWSRLVTSCLFSSWQSSECCGFGFAFGGRPVGGCR